MGFLKAGDHQAFVEYTLVMKHQGRPMTDTPFFMRCSLTIITMFLIAESVMLGSRAKFSKVFLLEATTLVFSSFEVVSVKMYVMICIKRNLIM